MTAFLLHHAPALMVGLPLACAFLLLAAGHAGTHTRNHIFLTGLALGAATALLLAMRVLCNGEIVQYVFGARGASPLVPGNTGGIPIRIAFIIDAIGAVLLIPAAIISTLSGIYSLRSEESTDGQTYFQPLFLLLTAGVYGMFATGDLFNFFVFLEITSMAGAALAAYRLDGPEATEAAFKYAAVSTLGALIYLMGVGILLAEHNALNMAQIARAIMHSGVTTLDITAFGLMLIPLLLKCGVFPLHQWVPDVYSRAPDPVTAFLLISSQASLYAVFRISYTVIGPFMPLAPLSLLLVIMALLSMFIGVTMALVQHDVKRLISHHAVSQTGYMLLGAGVCIGLLDRPDALAAFGREALAGSLFHIVNYALYNSLLFLAAGAVIHRTRTRDLNQLGGLAHQMPWTAACFGIGALAIAGIPPLSGFASKWVIYTSVFRYSPLLSIIAMVVSLLTLASFAKVFHSMFLSAPRPRFAEATDPPPAMLLPMFILALLTLLIGLFPGFMMQRLFLPAADALLHNAPYLSLLGGHP